MPLVKQIAIPGKDVGKGALQFSWNATSRLVAVSGSAGKVFLISRQGTVEHQFPLANVTHMQWDNLSDTLALCTGKKGVIHFYSHRIRKVDTSDTGMSDIAAFRWAAKAPLLVAGSSKGDVVIFNRSTQQLTPVSGVHTQSIVDVAWTQHTNHCVVVGEDRQLSVLDVGGAVLSKVPLSGTPVSFVIYETKPTATAAGKAVAVVNLGRALQVVSLYSGETFTSQFQTELGSIECVTANPSGGVVFVGFSSGTVGIAAIEGGEMHLASHISAFRNKVSNAAYGPGSGLYLASSDNTVKLFGVSSDVLIEIADDSVTPEEEFGPLREVKWSTDGQCLCLDTASGTFVTYAFNVPNVSAACGSLVFYFTSSRVVGVKNIREGIVLCTIPIDIDPKFMAAGMSMMAVGTGNAAYFYEYFIPNSIPQGLETPLAGGKDARKTHSQLIRKMEYSSAITDVKVCSHFAAVCYDGKAHLHTIREGENEQSMIFPGPNESKVIAVGLSETLFLYVTANKVTVLALRNLQPVAEYNFNSTVKRAFPNPMCTRVACIDEANSLVVLNPVTEGSCAAEGYEASHKQIMWDQMDATVFVSHDTKSFITYVCAAHSRHGATCESALVRNSNNENLYTPLPANHTPVSLCRGTITAQATNGQLMSLLLNSHIDTTVRVPNTDAFYNNYCLHRLRWASQNISTPSEAEDLAHKALHMLDIELAIRVYRQLSQPTLVLCLEKIKHIHEKNLLLGHVSMIMGYFKEAQTFFLRSSQPLCALEMRRDLMQWEPALALAKEMAEDQVPIISKEYAQQLEYRGEYVKALGMFKNGKRPLPTGHASTELTAAQQEVKSHNEQCVEGTARCLIRTGSVKEGVDIALKSENKEFVRDCAKLCEETQRFEEAAQLCEKAGDVEHAATLYIERSKNLKAAGRLLPQIKSRNIVGLYASAKEAEGSFKEAEQAFTQSEDWDNVVRIKVEKLNDLHGAYVIVRNTRSVDAAALVANMCKKKGEFGTAVEFLVLAKSTGEAFELAKEKNCMFNYESALLSQMQLQNGVAPLQFQPDFIMIAEYYEDMGKPGQSAMYYHIAGNYTMALKKYMEAGEPEDIEKAVEVVGKARSDALTNKLIDYLMGESDGEPKDPSYIFKLYMALGSYEKAAKTSVIIASKEQEIGNYKSAHGTLVEACRILKDKGMRIPNDLRRTLMLLHSYIIVKDVIKIMQDESTACRMLLRVSRNIQKFPKHIVTIVTSTVLQCAKSGFAKSAFEFACVLVQSEKYRMELSDKHRKKIEGIVRKRGKDALEDPVEAVSPCPFCDAPVVETELECGACKNALPFCIVSGKHIVKTDFTTMPCCTFPAIYSLLMKRLQETSPPTCPMCEATVDINAVRKQTDPDMTVF